MRKATFIKHIEQLGKDELREELTSLFAKIPAVSQFYAMELGTEDQRIKAYEKAKKEIESKYKTKSYRKPRRPRIQKVKKVISDLEKLSVFSYDMIDIHLFNVECAVFFHCEYNYSSDPLFNSITNSFKTALDLIQVNLMEQKYEERCRNVVQKKGMSYDIKKQVLNLFHEIYES